MFGKILSLVTNGTVSSLRCKNRCNIRYMEDSNKGYARRNDDAAVRPSIRKVPALIRPTHLIVDVAENPQVFRRFRQMGVVAQWCSIPWVRLRVSCAVHNSDKSASLCQLHHCRCLTRRDGIRPLLPLARNSVILAGLIAAFYTAPAAGWTPLPSSTHRINLRQIYLVSRIWRKCC